MQGSWHFLRHPHMLSRLPWQDNGRDFCPPHNPCPSSPPLSSHLPLLPYTSLPPRLSASLPVRQPCLLSLLTLPPSSHHLPTLPTYTPCLAPGKHRKVGPAVSPWRPRASPRCMPFFAHLAAAYTLRFLPHAGWRGQRPPHHTIPACHQPLSPSFSSHSTLCSTYLFSGFIHPGRHTCDALYHAQHMAHDNSALCLRAPYSLPHLEGEEGPEKEEVGREEEVGCGGRKSLGGGEGKEEQRREEEQTDLNMMCLELSFCPCHHAFTVPAHHTCPSLPLPFHAPCTCPTPTLTLCLPFAPFLYLVSISSIFSPFSHTACTAHACLPCLPAHYMQPLKTFFLCPTRLPLCPLPRQHPLSPNSL